jgi:hypothetical protein
VLLVVYHRRLDFIVIYVSVPPRLFLSLLYGEVAILICVVILGDFDDRAYIALT